MDLYAICLRALEQAGEDAAGMEDRRGLLVDAVNAGLWDLYRYYAPWTEETAEADGAGVIDLTGLSRPCLRVLGIWRVGRTLGFSQAGVDRIIAEGAGTQGEAGDEHGGALVVRYRYGPRRLLANGDIPELPERWHTALADYATYRLLGVGSRAGRSDFFFSAYLRARSEMSAAVGSRERDMLAHKYGACGAGGGTTCRA